MRKIIIGGAAAALGVSTLLASGASAGGNGAQVSPLSAQPGSTTDNCQQGDGSGGYGFVMLNAPGQPGNASKLIGEVSLKNGAPDTTYTVNVAPVGGNDKCMPETTLTTNGVGNGNAHIADPTLGNGSFYVVLQVGNQEAFASQLVAVN